MPRLCRNGEEGGEGGEAIDRVYLIRHRRSAADRCVAFRHGSDQGSLFVVTRASAVGMGHSNASGLAECVKAEAHSRRRIDAIERLNREGGGRMGPSWMWRAGAKVVRDPLNPSILLHYTKYLLYILQHPQGQTLSSISQSYIHPHTL